ncbi:MAG: hypothetical protein IT435_07895 [Phycisphaerales bacterium]|nr:hypothetical protein [Phycisphaerales bacterium]
MKRDPNKYPPGLDRKKVQKILDYYENQSEEDAIAEADAAWENSHMTLIPVPNELAQKVRQFIAIQKTKSTPRARRKTA